MTDAARVEQCGDAAVLVRLDGPQAWATGQSLARSLLADRPGWLVDVLAAYASVLVTVDPLAADGDPIRAELLRRLGQHQLDLPEPHEFTVPVVYDGADLPGVAAEVGWSTRELIDWHTGSPWTVRVVASPAGAPLTDGPMLPAPIARVTPPRLRVPAGSVALSGRQCIVYPVTSPGGWRLIGHTPQSLADPAADPIVAHRPGDRLRFVEA